MSTTAEIERRPERSRRCFIHAGVGARGSMPSISRATKRGHASGSSTRTGRTPSNVTGVAATAGGTNGAPVMAATSCAMPAMDRQSARLGVILSVISVSSSASASRTGVPGARAGSSASRPLASSSMPSSFAEHSIPRDSTPRIVARLIATPPGSTAPSSAHGASMPTAALGAPHTIASASGPPTSTVHTRRRSAFGCGATAVDARDDHAGERRRRRRGLLDLEARHRQPVGQVRARQRRIAHRAQPVFGEFHRLIRFRCISIRACRCRDQANWRRKRRSFS